MMVLFLSTFFTFAFPKKAEAKFWGEESTYGVNEIAADGNCWRKKTVTYYVFWIPVSSGFGGYVPCD
jgi:hypothetical protein